MNALTSDDKDNRVPLADDPSTTQDDLTPPPGTTWGPRHAGRPPQQRKTPTGRYQQFAQTLADAMNRNGLSASEVARRVWGTTKDRRGHEVARNRDRIGHYLSGNSYPEPANLMKLAEAVGLSVEELAMPVKPDLVQPGGRASAGTQLGGLRLDILPDRKLRIRGQIDRVISASDLQRLIDLLLGSETEGSDNDYRPGDIVNGNNGTSGD